MHSSAMVVDMVRKTTEWIFLSELAAVIESSKTCRRSRSDVEIPVLENLLKLPNRLELVKS